jgi:hypothetical protein
MVIRATFALGTTNLALLVRRVMVVLSERDNAPGRRAWRPAARCVIGAAPLPKPVYSPHIDEKP